MFFKSCSSTRFCIHYLLLSLFRAIRKKYCAFRFGTTHFLTGKACHKPVKSSRWNDKTISTKHIECVFDPEKGEVIDADVDSDMQCTCCLEDLEVKELVRIAKEIESHYGRHMDIEWAIDKDLEYPDNMFIVQARPETVWSQKKAEPVLGKKTGYQLLMDQAMKRIKFPS